MKCPKCGYERQGRDDAFVPASECPACGIVYSKHEHVKDPNPASGLAPPPHLKPSPVDAASLKKARERVEKRLRERLESQRVNDQRHTQTLRLAKRLTAEQIRLRRQEWEKAHGSTQAEEPVQEAAEASLASVPPASAAAQQTDHEPVETTEFDHSDRPGEELQAATTTPATQPESTPAPIAADPGVLPQTSLQDDQSQDAGAEKPVPEPIDPEQATAPDVDQEAVLLEEIVVVSVDQPEPELQEDPVNEAVPPMPETVVAPESEPAVDAICASGSASDQPIDRRSGTGLARLFTVVAWIILGAGLAGAVLSWATITDVQAALRGTLPGSFGSLPLGLLLGFAYLATGVLGFAFFWVSSLISTQLKDIRSLLMALPAPRPDDDSKSIGAAP